MTHTVEPELNIVKLITDQEIKDQQDFFEQCAKDYRKLGEQLVFTLVDKLELNLNKDFPLDTFNELKLDDRQIGTKKIYENEILQSVTNNDYSAIIFGTRY